MNIGIINTFRSWLKRFPLLRKFLKFGIVGATSAAVSLAVFWLIVNQYPSLNLLSKGVGYVMGFFVGFIVGFLEGILEGFEVVGECVGEVGQTNAHIELEESQ